MLYKLFLNLIVALTMFSTASGKADVIVFLQTNDANTQIYARDLKTSHEVAITKDLSVSVASFDVHGDWVVYTYDQDSTPIVLLNWKTQESQILLDCMAYEITCWYSRLKFSADGEQVFLETGLGTPTVWLINLSDPVPQVFAQHEGIAYIAWLSGNHFLYSYRDDNHNTQRVLYDITTQDAVEVDSLLSPEDQNNRLVAMTPDGLNMVFYSYFQEEFVLVNHTEALRQSYPLADTGFAPYAGVVGSNHVYELMWKPDSTAFLYFTPDGLFLYDLATQTIHPLWTGALVSEAQWNGGSQIIFVVGSHAQQGALWLYDMERETATSLSINGYGVRWLTAGI